MRSWLVIHIFHHTADIVHLAFLLVLLSHLILKVLNHSPFKSCVNMTVQMIPIVEVLIVARDRVMTKNYACTIAEGYFLVINDFNKLLPEISTLNELVIVITNAQILFTIQSFQNVYGFQS